MSKRLANPRAFVWLWAQGTLHWVLPSLILLFPFLRLLWPGHQPFGQKCVCFLSRCAPGATLETLRHVCFALFILLCPTSPLHLQESSVDTHLISHCLLSITNVIYKTKLTYNMEGQEVPMSILSRSHPIEWNISDNFWWLKMNLKHMQRVNVWLWSLGI